MTYESVIGLEVHVELETRSKLFCSCANHFGAEPNTLCCPTCLGLPGSLPVLNRAAVDLALRAAVALDCTIAPMVHFDRKHYFYPDLPRGYQITQHATPIGSKGFLEIETDTGVRTIGIARVHLEDDAGKLVHADIGEEQASLVDFNRSGVPLIEIVTAPDLRSPGEARQFLETLKSVLQYLGVSDCKMQEGSLRCDANLSLRRPDEMELGIKTELKNVNSFRTIERALEYERQRQSTILRTGGKVAAETRRWDDARGQTAPMRSKEQTHDYRYFPEPDLPALLITEQWVDHARSDLPELPVARRRRLLLAHDLSEYEALMITRSRALADLYERIVAQGIEVKFAANWLLGEVSRLVNANELEWGDLPIEADELVILLRHVADGKVAAITAKELLTESFAEGKPISAMITGGLATQISDEEELRTVVVQAVVSNPQTVADYQGGKERALLYLVGQVMKSTGGRANPSVVNQLLREELLRRR